MKQENKKLIVKIWRLLLQGVHVLFSILLVDMFEKSHNKKLKKILRLFEQVSALRSLRAQSLPCVLPQKGIPLFYNPWKALLYPTQSSPQFTGWLLSELFLRPIRFSWEFVWVNDGKMILLAIGTEAGNDTIKQSQVHRGLGKVNLWVSTSYELDWQQRG